MWLLFCLLRSTPMQDDLFGALQATEPAATVAGPARMPAPRGKVQPVRLADVPDAVRALAHRLPRLAHLGTSSWTYPGWTGHIWATDLSERVLSRHGLSAYSEHPLMRTVSVDRNLYKALTASQFAEYAAQVPDDFRFIVKAPASVSDALIRDEHGRGRGHNPLFLDPALAEREFIRPALEGLRHKIGALVFQLSPLPPEWVRQPQKLHDHLARLLATLPSLMPTAPHAVMAVELRDASLVTRELADVLKAAGATYCLGLHARMPPIEEQLPLLRALWPAPLVCRWNLHRRHGAYGYEAARDLYAPFDHIQDADVDTRDTLARVIRATTGAGLPAYVSISNKAEGCAPLSVVALAEALCGPQPVESGGNDGRA